MATDMAMNRPVSKVIAAETLRAPVTVIDTAARIRMGTVGPIKAIVSHMMLRSGWMPTAMGSVTTRTDISLTVAPTI